MATFPLMFLVTLFLIGLGNTSLLAKVVLHWEIVWLVGRMTAYASWTIHFCLCWIKISLWEVIREPILLRCCLWMNFLGAVMVVKLFATLYFLLMARHLMLWTEKVMALGLPLGRFELACSKQRQIFAATLIPVAVRYFSKLVWCWQQKKVIWICGIVSFPSA